MQRRRVRGKYAKICKVWAQISKVATWQAKICTPPVEVWSLRKYVLYVCSELRSKRILSRRRYERILICTFFPSWRLQAGAATFHIGNFVAAAVKFGVPRRSEPRTRTCHVAPRRETSLGSREISLSARNKRSAKHRTQSSILLSAHRTQ